MVVSYGADGVDVGAVVLRGRGVRIWMEDAEGWDLLRIWTCALVGRLGGTNLAARMGIGNILLAETRG